MAIISWTRRRKKHEYFSIPSVRITATLDEQLLWNRFRKATGGGTKLTQGSQLVNFVRSYSAKNDSLNVSQQARMDVSSDGVFDSTYSSGSANQNVKMKMGTGELNEEQLNILYNETGLFFRDAKKNRVKSFNPNDLNSPTFIINWPTADGKKARKQDWTYGEMFDFYFKNKNQNSVSGDAAIK